MLQDDSTMKLARRIGRIVARDPAGGVRRQDVIAAVGTDVWRRAWGLAYGMGFIDFVGDFVVAPAPPETRRPAPKQPPRPACTQTSARGMLFLSGHHSHRGDGT